MTIPNIVIPKTGIKEVNIPHIWGADVTIMHPQVPYVPVTTHIGKPIVEMPGCVEVNENNNTGAGGTKNKSLVEDDNARVYCDEPGMAGYNAMDYVPDQLVIEQEAPPPPPVEPPPEIDPPEVPDTGELGAQETECPAPNQPRVGDLTANGEEKVVGHELQGTTCVVLYEDTTTAEKFLPSTNQVSVTAAIAVVATASAAATPLLLRIIKPVIKKLTTTVQKKLGKHREMSKSEIQANAYRAKKGLPPLKLKKK